MPPEVTNPESAVVKGGLPDHGSQAPATKPETTVPEKTKTVFKLGSKVFETAEEASKYVESLESEKTRLSEVAAQTAQPQVTIPQTPKRHVINGRPIEEVLFEDPEKVVDYITDQATKIADQKAAQAARNQALWKKFFEKNPDLRGKQRILDSVLNENLKGWSNLSEEDGMKMLAQTTRSELKSMGLASGKVEELLKSDPATLSSQTSETGITTDTDADRPVTSFTDEIFAMRKKRMAAAAKR